MEKTGSEPSRRAKNFFNNMAEALNNGRDNLKCRSHHQKMLRKYGNIKGIVEALFKEEESTTGPYVPFSGMGAFQLYSH